MTQGARIERVGEEFREILAEEIPKLKDPRVGFVTVVGVKVSPDLRSRVGRVHVDGRRQGQGRHARSPAVGSTRTCGP